MIFEAIKCIYVIRLDFRIVDNVDVELHSSRSVHDHCKRVQLSFVVIQVRRTHRRWSVLYRGNFDAELHRGISRLRLFGRLDRHGGNVDWRQWWVMEFPMNCHSLNRSSYIECVCVCVCVPSEQWTYNGCMDSMKTTHPVNIWEPLFHWSVFPSHRILHYHWNWQIYHRARHIDSSWCHRDFDVSDRISNESIGKYHWWRRRAVHLVSHRDAREYYPCHWSCWHRSSTRSINYWKS